MTESSGINRSVDVVVEMLRHDEVTPIGTAGHTNQKEPKMRAYNLLPIVSLVLFIAYSALAITTDGAATGIASPMLVAAIAMLVWHDRATEKA